MARKHDSYMYREIVEGASRSAFVLAWANWMEEKGKTFPGARLEDVAPKTSV